MKIEKLSDNQIRCTLNKSDLASRQLKISELAYGSEKAKDLFRDMIQQASYELGFDAEDIPLMIEAIPVSTDCIILVITKVEDPEELDTRFSKFAPSITDDENDYDPAYDGYEESFSDVMDSNDDTDNGADDVINLFNKVKDYLNKNIDGNNADKNEDILKNNFVPFNKSLKNSGNNSNSNNENRELSESELIKSELNETDLNVIRIFSFHSLNHITDAANIVSAFYESKNVLYKNNKTGIYYLVIDKCESSPVTFNKVCNILTEYGTKEPYNYASVSYFEEHYELIIKENALKVLSSV